MVWFARGRSRRRQAGVRQVPKAQLVCRNRPIGEVKERKDLRAKPTISERRISVWQTALRGSLEVSDLTHPAGQWVPSGENLVHQLQVVDSERLKSPTHSVDRTAVHFVVERRTTFVVLRFPEPLSRSRQNPRLQNSIGYGRTRRKIPLITEFPAGPRTDSRG